MDRPTIICTVLGLGLCLAALPACRPSDADIDELKTQQRQILAKLDDLAKKVERPPAPRRRGPDPDKQYDLPVDKSPVRGPEDAPVTIVEFADYQCPFCAHSVPLFQSIFKEYPGEVKLVYKHLPLAMIHPNALPAAQAAVAAQNQGKFWEMHDLLFANQRALKADQLREYAQQIGLDMEQFEKDMKSPETRKIIQDDMRLSRSVGVRGTPTIFVNGKLVQQRTLDGIKSMIDSQLKEDATG